MAEVFQSGIMENKVTFLASSQAPVRVGHVNPGERSVANHEMTANHQSLAVLCRIPRLEWLPCRNLERMYKSHIPETATDCPSLNIFELSLKNLC